MPAPRSSLLKGQRGALFGLDARIALTIFAAIAIIAGYVAFGRLDMARDSAQIAELEAIDNALLSYQAHTNTFFPFTLAGKDDLTASETDLTALWSKDVIKPGFQASWSGPYLHREGTRSTSGGTYSLTYAGANAQNECTEETPCYVWIKLSGTKAELWSTINAYVDEAYGRTPEEPGTATTRGRIQADGEGPTRTLFYRSVERPNP